MTGELVVGVDVGGTKTHVRAVVRGEVRHDVVLSSLGWAVPPIEAGAQWLADRVREVVGSTSIAALAVGAHGCEQDDMCAALGTALAERLGAPALVVNDAELLVPAAGLDGGIGVVVGTGAIAVTRDSSGRMLRAGGWGWVFSDDGSASALVREAVRAVLARADAGEHPDALGVALLRSVDVPDVAALAHRLSWGSAAEGDGPEHWGGHAPAVTAAAAAGVPDAAAVFEAGARGVAALVTTLAGRGVPVGDVVLGGGLATGVPEYAAVIRRHVVAACPEARVAVLTEPPVTGAVRLAVRLAGEPAG
ncbi:BadF/BadG/BcrA/BcrD ATPase family protein [Pseudonocardia sp. TRM90224]|uniref:BadF/BadG/BcrA/BcrD ATPase family protein n=1 Tax=Pseudonocardia sp. TRM90224 TaxID=2812678 RepID=UPI001E46E03E|nr:BadF/BadG/BcrA/BcrD ATPase family protein [Pseudonocardia sp. TRM90224]